MSKAKARDVVEDVINDSAAERQDDDDKPSPYAGRGKAAGSGSTVGVLPDWRWSRLKNTAVIAKREFFAYFDSPLAYVLIGLSMIAVGVLMFFLEGNF